MRTIPFSDEDRELYIDDLTAEEEHVLTHTLTGSHDTGTVSRNWFAAGERCKWRPHIDALVEKGLMAPGRVYQTTPDVGQYFHCTQAGAHVIGLFVPPNMRGFVVYRLLAEREAYPACVEPSRLEGDNLRQALETLTRLPEHSVHDVLTAYGRVIACAFQAGIGVELPGIGELAPKQTRKKGAIQIRLTPSKELRRRLRSPNQWLLG